MHSIQTVLLEVLEAVMMSVDVVPKCIPCLAWLQTNRFELNMLLAEPIHIMAE